MIHIPKPVLVDAAKLKPAPYNPRKLPKRMLAALKASIRAHGFVEPVVIQKRTRMIIGGHQRVLALKEVCREDGEMLPKIPCVVLDIDDKQAKVLNLALNKITGDFDTDLLAAVFADLKDETMTTDEILSSGFTAKEIDNIIAKTSSDDGDLSSFASSVTLSLKFDTVEERDAVKALLAEQSNTSGKKSGTLVRELLDAQGRALAS